MRKVLDLIWGAWEQKYFRKIRNKTRQPCQETARRANHLRRRERSGCSLDEANGPRNSQFRGVVVEPDIEAYQHFKRINGTRMRLHEALRQSAAIDR